MKKIALALGLALVATSAMAQKDCETLKSEIAVKLKEKGVKDYTLEVLTADKAKNAKVVGSCEAGNKKIVYKRG